MKSYLLLIAVVLLIAGCGGGGGGSTSSGTVRGTLSNLPLAQTRGTQTLTVGVEGTNLTTTVEPGKEFTLTGVPAGLHTLTIDNDSYGKSIVIQVGSKLVTEIGELAVENAGKISGTITDADTTKPIAGAVVTLTEAIATTTATTNAMPHPVRVKRTAADGTYTFRGILPGSYIVNIAARGYVSSSMMVDVTAQTVSTASIALKKDTVVTTNVGTLKGTVYLESDGKSTPLTGALVRLRPVVENSDDAELGQPLPAMLYQVVGDANRPMNVDSATGNMNSVPECPRELIAYTDENGNYLIENIPAGSYHAVAVSPGMNVKGNRVTVTIATNSGTVQDFTLTLKQITGIVVTGTVTDDVTKKPIANAGVRCILGNPTPLPAITIKRNAQVYEMNAASGEGMLIKPTATGSVDSMVIYTITDADGKYKLISPAVSGIAVNAVGYTPQEKSITTDTSPQVVDFALTSLQAGTITGVVKNAAGDGIPGAKIFADYPVFYADGNTSAGTAITNLGNPESRATTTDANGHFSIKTLPGSVILYVKAEGYQTLQKEVNVIANTETPVEITLKAVVLGKITGVVKDSVTNLPIAGAVINRDAVYQALDAVGNTPTNSIVPTVAVPEKITTDADGKYTLENQPIGQVTLTCIKAGYEISYKTVILIDTTPVQADFSLVPLPKPATVSGIITGPDDKPIVGAIVSAGDLYYIASTNTSSRMVMPPISNWVVKTDENGKYSLAVPAWVKSISVVANGYKNSINPVTLQPGIETVLNVKLEAKPVL
ncbi:MAG: carboxypeptidase regulatory-like domain-containing protein [bacterium]